MCVSIPKVRSERGSAYLPLGGGDDLQFRLTGDLVRQRKAGLDGDGLVGILFVEARLGVEIFGDVAPLF